MSSSMYLYSVFVLALVGLSAASHGRFGTVSFERVPNSLNVKFTFNAVFRRTYFGYPNVGDTVYDASFDFGDGQWYQIPMRVDNMNTAQDWISVSWEGFHSYGSAGVYQAGWSSCCRIFALNNNPSYGYAFKTTVNLSTPGTDASPVSSMLPIVSVPFGVVGYQYQVTAVDPEGQPLSYRMATASEMGDGSSVHPPGLSVNSAGVVTLGAQLAHGYWTTQQVITDVHGNAIVVDYLIEVKDTQTACSGTGSCGGNVCASDADCAACSNSVCISAVPRLVTSDITSSATPATNYPSPARNAVLNLSAGQTYKINFVADDENVYASAPTIYSASLPSYATQLAQKDCSAANGCQYRGPSTKPQWRQIELKPLASDAGPSVVCVGVTSLGNPLPYSQHCVTLQVSAQVCGNGAVEGSEVCDGGDCCNSDCLSFKTASVVCRASNGNCDVEEKCSGSSSACPVDSFLPSTTVCRASTGLCDAEEKCAGTASCPSDAFFGASKVCRPAADSCDIAESCTLGNSSCPADTFSNTAACRDGKVICPRLTNNTENGGAANLYCSPFGATAADRSVYYSCQTGAWAANSKERPCAPGTYCSCPYGMDCGKCGNPCLPAGSPPSVC